MYLAGDVFVRTSKSTGTGDKICAIVLIIFSSFECCVKGVVYIVSIPKPNQSSSEFRVLDTSPQLASIIASARGNRSLTSSWQWLLLEYFILGMAQCGSRLLSIEQNVEVMRRHDSETLSDDARHTTRGGVTVSSGQTQIYWFNTFHSFTERILGQPRLMVPNSALGFAT